MNVIGVIHAYPSENIVEALSSYELHLFVPIGYKRISNQKNVYVHKTELTETGECVDRICEEVRAYNIQVFLPLYEGGILLAALVSAKEKLNFYPVPTALASRNKYYLKQVLQSYGIKVPKTVPVYRFTPFSFINHSVGNPFVLKIVDSMNSQAVMLVRDEAEYHTKLNDLFKYLECDDIKPEYDRNRFCYGRDEVKVIAQEFCDGDEVNIDVMVCNGEKQALGIFRKADTKGPFFPETMSYYPSELSKEMEQSVIQSAEGACDALGINNGIIHAEFRMKDGNPHLLDMGLRPGGAYTIQAIEEIYGVNIITCIADILLNHKCEKIEIKRDISILYGGIVFRKSGEIRAIRGIDRIWEIENLKEFIQLANIKDIVVAPPFSAQPHFCYYYIVGEALTKNKETHCRLQQMIKLEIEEYKEGD